MSPRPGKLILTLAAMAIAVAACRGGDADVSAAGVSTDVGVTDKACPKAVNKDNGCIYLGTISDLTSGPFAPIAVPFTDAQNAFWQRVNEQGGIGGYDIDVTTYVRDNKYSPETHAQVYQEIKGKVLALAQTLGSPTTAAILDDMRSSNIVGVPASWTSAWEFEDVILESGSNYCYEAMNLVDYGVDELDAKTVMAVHYPGDAGDDAAAGAKIAAEEQGLTFTDVPTQQGPENQGGAVDKIVSKKPDVVVLTTGATDAAAVVGGAISRAYKGKFLGSNPTWNPALLKSPAADAFKENYLVGGFFGPFDADTAGHNAMREAVGNVTPNDGYVAGWTWSYPLKAALQKATEEGNLTRQGLLNAIKSLDTVDYEGILPAEAGNFSGEPGDATFRQTLIQKVDEDSATGVSVTKDFFAGPTAQKTALTKPCYQS